MQCPVQAISCYILSLGTVCNEIKRLQSGHNELKDAKAEQRSKDRTGMMDNN